MTTSKSNATILLTSAIAAELKNDYVSEYFDLKAGENRLESVSIDNNTYTFTLVNGETFQAHAGLIVAKLLSLPAVSDGDKKKTALLSNFRTGKLSKSIGLTVWEIGTKSANIGRVISAIVTPTQAIYKAILDSVSNLRELAHSIDDTMLEQYVEIVEKDKTLTWQGLSVDVTETVQLLALEKVQEHIDKISAFVLVSKNEIETIEPSSDSKKITVQLSNFDTASQAAIDEQCKLADYKTKWEILPKFRVAELIITLPVVKATEETA